MSLELYHRILIATDGSEFTKAATSHGLTLARISGAEVTALFVIDDTVYLNQTWSAMIPSGSTDLGSILEEEGRRAVESVRSEGEKLKVKVTPRIERGQPAKVIMELSKDFDIVVMGTLGRSGISKLLLGSVAEKVVRLADCPVLVVRDRRS